MLTVGSLFSGVGGIELGLERTGHFKTVWQVENDPYARKVLAKHWPDVRRWDDICTFTPDDSWGCDVITGGFPCQDVSNAGKRAGINGERSGLYIEAIRVVGQLKPRYVLLENVAALLGRGLGQVLADLAEIGYMGRWDCIPAGRFGAHFVGDRVFIVATSTAASGLRWQRLRADSMGSGEWGRDEFERLVRLEAEHGVPAGSFGRISDGVSHRVDRLRCLGNAVVPQVAQWLGERIWELHNRIHEVKDARETPS